jgi:HK97 gp10 family phage protein
MGFIQFKVTIKNKPEMVKGLASLKSMYPNVIGLAMKRVGDRVLETGNALVPIRTGLLKSTMGIRQDGNFQITFYATASYASFVEFGTRRMKPRQFMTKSLLQHKEEFPEEVKTALLNLSESLFGS